MLISVWAWAWFHRCIFSVDCSQRWDVIKQRAMEKRRRLKHNYQLWNQFLADVTSLRNWIVQYRPTYPVSEHIAAPSSDLHSPEDISHRQFMRFLAAASNDRSSPSFNLKKKSLPLTHLEQLIGMHKVRTLQHEQIRPLDQDWENIRYLFKYQKYLMFSFFFA